jgi:hypothetical protein
MLLHPIMQFRNKTQKKQQQDYGIGLQFMDPKNNFDAVIDFDEEMASETDSRIPKNRQALDLNLFN